MRYQLRHIPKCCKDKKKTALKLSWRCIFHLCGEGGIRTPGTVIPYVSLANWWFKPLTHLTERIAKIEAFLKNAKFICTFAAVTNDHTPQKLLPVLLKAGALGVAILLGFLLGIIVGDRNRRKPKVEAGAVDSLAVEALMADTLAADTTAVVAPEEPEAPAEPETPEAYQPTKKEIAAGVEYLAKHNRWNRDEMEKFPALQGLWDAVNTYNLEEIKRYNDYLSSTPLITIVEGLEKSPKHGYYAARNDHVITLSTYIKRLR